MNEFVDEQKAFWAGADAAHFAWQTGTPILSDAEASLVDGLDLRAGEKLLEIGCGEGGNLHHVAARAPGAHLYGIDFSAPKAAFARRVTGARTACADAARLPFCDAAFDAVLVRDLLHHVPDRAAVWAEARRVLRPGGRVVVVEPNGKNPLVRLQATLFPAERHALSVTGDTLAGEARAAGFAVDAVERRWPLGLERVVLHPKLGAPRLGRLAAMQHAFQYIGMLANRLPDRLWLYYVLKGHRPA